MSFWFYCLQLTKYQKRWNY